MRLPFLLFVLFISSSANSQKNEKRATVVQLKDCNRVDTAYDSFKKKIIGIGKREIFFIQNYNPNDSLILDKYINEFVRKKSNKHWKKKYTDYVMAFYKESNDLNLDILSKKPQVFWEKSRDLNLVYYYLWTNNKFYGMDKHHNVGSKFTITDVNQ